MYIAYYKKDKSIFQDGGMHSALCDFDLICVYMKKKNNLSLDKLPQHIYNIQAFEKCADSSAG